MYLKSIELYGFKSFANKTILKFNKGITGVVGPNGSGKSNVADAVRWVLGEQSARQLRGNKMEDVIFSGTENRKPMGMAYVAITLDNTGYEFPVEADELTVARRVYRSGESEYLINGRSSRLKDVQELFFDTGIGKEGYSIIGQGQIDKILSGKPEERRELFDEAAGIVKFKKRKALAEKNLDTEKQNLYRITDILSELERQIGPLESQAKKAKEYLNLRDHLRMFDIQMYIHEYNRSKKVLSDYEERLKTVRADYDSCKEQMEFSKVEFHTVQNHLEELNGKIDDLKEKINQCKLEKEKNESDYRLAQEQLRGLESNLSHYIERKTKLEIDLEEKKKKRQEWTQSYSAIHLQTSKLEKLKQSIEEKIVDKNTQIDALKKKIDAKNSEIIESLNYVGSLKVKVQRYDTMIEQINIRKSELNQRLLTLQSETVERANKLAQCREEKEKLESEKTSLEEQQLSFQDTGVKIQSVIDACHRDLSTKEKEYHRAFSKVQMLRGIAERYEGYGNSVKKVMEQKVKEPGILGVVADIIQVDQNYETAIETALGGSIQNIVTKDENTAKKLIEFLKRNRFGRATFLPMTNIVAKKLQDKERLISESGVLGIGSDLVHYEGTFSNLADYLLGRVIVVDTIDHALKLAKKYHYSHRIVTLEGELLNPGGSISGGHYRNSTNFFGRNRELEEGQAYIERLKKDLEQLNQSTDEAHEKKRVNKRKLSVLQENLQNLRLKLNTLSVQIHQFEASESDQSAAYERLRMESEELKNQMVEIGQLKGERTDEQEKTETLKQENEKLLTTLNEQLEVETLKHKKQLEVREKLNIQYSAQLQKQHGMDENIHRLDLDVQTIDRELDTLSVEIQNGQKDIREKTDVLAELSEKQQKRHPEDSDFTDRLKTLGEEKQKTQLKVQQLLEFRDSLSERSSLLDKDVMRLENLIEKADSKRSDLSSYMWDTYELTYNQALLQLSDLTKDWSLDDIQKKIAELKKDIRDLGNINMESIDEYTEVSNRYNELKLQYDDLIESEEKLKDIILDLDQSMRDQFEEKFKDIQSNFDHVFKELFGGGKGSLELVEDTDILEAGIRIIAQPPGKRLQNMMQLSGGEKALTAIALLFAIQRLKPSPFCLLDEIEAALDDANVKRYARYLNHLTDDTQFIIITHRRGTMNAADVLYGVTMQEKGVSALVSVNLIENDLIK